MGKMRGVKRKTPVSMAFHRSMSLPMRVIKPASFTQTLVASFTWGGALADRSTHKVSSTPFLANNLLKKEDAIM